MLWRINGDRDDPIMTRHPSEHAEQVAIVAWFRVRWPGVRIFAIPNGGARNVVVASKLKAEGVSPGVPDLHVPAWRLWVEVKRAKGGRLSPEQRDWIGYLESIGDACLVVKGFDDARRQIEAFAADRKKN